MNGTFDVVCVGVAIVDSIIRGFDPEPVSAGRCGPVQEDRIPRTDRILV